MCTLTAESGGLPSQLVEAGTSSLPRIVAERVTFVKRERKGNAAKPEWPLVKSTVIPGIGFPVAVAVEAFFEVAARLGEPAEVFGAAFEPARLNAIGPIGNQVSSQVYQ